MHFPQGFDDHYESGVYLCAGCSAAGQDASSEGGPVNALVGAFLRYESAHPTSWGTSRPPPPQVSRGQVGAHPLLASGAEAMNARFSAVDP